jgi:hypothetical protein
MTQHASLSPERWAQFGLDKQILMIGNEMNRAKRLIEIQDISGLRLAYERVLRLVDLTLDVQQRPSLKRELLLWRDLVASLAGRLDPGEHLAAFRSLLLFTPVAAQQIPYVLP